MHFGHYIFRAFTWTIIGILIAIYVYCLLALGFSRIPFSTPSYHDCIFEDTIFVASNGVHLSFVLPENSLSSELKTHLSLPHAKYFVFGWGDLDFYVETPEWKDLQLTTALKAVFLPTTSAIHLTFYQKKMPGWNQLPVCAHQMGAVEQYILKSFYHDPDGNFVVLEALNYSQDNHFFKGNGKYSLLFTSNNWVNKGLQVSGLPAVVWSPFDFAVLRILNRAVYD